MAWFLLLSVVIGLAFAGFFLSRYCCGFMDEFYPRLILGNTFQKFKNEMEKLITRRSLLLKKVKETNNKTMKVNDDVLEWLHEVEKLLEEAKKLMKIEIETDSNSLSTRQKHLLYDELQTKAKSLNTKYEFFEPFSNQIPSIRYFSFGNIEWFTSPKEALEFILEALSDDSSYIVGMHGMRDSGKTKLAKGVAEKAKLLKIFDRVVLATVPQYPNVNRIQGVIAEWLNLELDGCSEGTGAVKIFGELSSKKRTLVILDNVRTKLELLLIGIPTGNKRCKVLLTTPSLQVCDLMQCDRVVTLHPLSKEEAWMWFKKHARIDDESPSNILNVAREIVTQCKGIPQTIKEVGYCLRRKPIEEWKASLDKLRYSMSTARYQIFLSFRGKDTRYSFAGSLYYALSREGFKTFMDEEGLVSGDQISQSLINAIQASRLCIVVFSENFAYSTWCLDELVTILECMQTKKQMVWPIFYKVEPSDVRHQKNSYGLAMEVHGKRFGDDSEKVQKWKLALSEIANLSGEHYKNGYEYEFILKIVKKTENIKDRLRLKSMN